MKVRMAGAAALATCMLAAVPAVMPAAHASTIDEFSLTRPEGLRHYLVVQQLQSAMGQRVQLTYSQHVGIPTTCFGETSYFVDKASVGGSNPVSPSNM